ncbi:MAG: four helix bundle protein [Longimicrobiales bacterium]|nr:four helix bundle protein [Longimicrobiales bacterium]
MTNSTSVVFDHERLHVYQRALDLMEAADRFAPLFGSRRRHLGWQLHRAAAAVVLNIAEGNGRSTGPDRSHFMLISLGSAAECAAVMDIADRLEIGTPDDRSELKRIAEECLKMLAALSRNTRNRSPTDPGRSYS